jgi:outer membrane biosynthesis protein TonB
MFNKNLYPLLVVVFMIHIPAVAQVSLTTAADESEAMLFADDPQEWSRPRLVVRPEFSKNELDKRVRAYVDVTVDIDNRGRVKSSMIAKSDPPTPGYEKALKDVIGLWLFEPKLDSKCVCVEATANVRVWFDVKDGKGVLSVSGKPITAQPEKLRYSREELEAVAKKIRQNILYPQLARKEGDVAEVNVVMEVDAASGRVINVEPADFYSSSKANSQVKRSFINAIDSALKSVSFSPTLGSPFKVCMVFSFRLTG